ncbi:MAG: hypothetical protein IAE83_15285 [Anaerolinea sp.]|nr:hypothetical protein [Anaerolinea sp.]
MSSSDHPESGAVSAFQRLRSRIKPRERLPIWRLRLIFGMVCLTFSEVVMWQNPPRRAWFEWIALYVLYTALGAIFLDLAVRFQVRTPASLGLSSGVYGMAACAIINHTAYENIPFGLLARGMGLQVGAGFLALMTFLIVMRGKRPDPLQVGLAGVVGVAWGLWMHWYPIQPNVNWGLVTLESAQIYLLAPLLVMGALFQFGAPRFGTFREGMFALQWWEAILVGAPLFIALMVGMINGAIPFLPLLIPAAVIAFCVWALRWQMRRRGYEPSILANITFIAPNLLTYVAMAAALIFVGSLAYPLIDGAGSPFGVALYFVVTGFGSAWLPFACGLIFWELLRTDWNEDFKKKK